MCSSFTCTRNMFTVICILTFFDTRDKNSIVLSSVLFCITYKHYSDSATTSAPSFSVLLLILWMVEMRTSQYVGKCAYVQLPVLCCQVIVGYNHFSPLVTAIVRDVSIAVAAFAGSSGISNMYPPNFSDGHCNLSEKFTFGG